MEERIKDIINDAEIKSGLLKLTSSKGNSYFKSYPYFISFFEKNNIIKSIEVLYQGANMVYGWMPTILDTQKNNKIYSDCEVIESIERLDHRFTDPKKEDLEIVAAFMNNSIVGASKLLHFIYPKKYPIWDSKICGHILGSKGASSQVKKIENYISYYKALKNIKDHQTLEKLSMFKDSFKKEFKDNFKNEEDTEISTVRAAELIIFLDAQLK